jgi:hypothetical protein
MTMSFSSTLCHVALVCFLSLSVNTQAQAQAQAIGSGLTETVNLGTAGNYAILTKAGITTVPDSVITGDIAVSPIAIGGMTGFDFTLDSGETFSTCTQVSGKAYAASYNAPTPAHLTTAVSDMETAYTDAAGRTTPDAARINRVGGVHGTLTPGVYTFTTAVLITEPIHFNGDGIYVIQISKTLTQAADTTMILDNGARAENIFWTVAEAVAVGARAHMEGILLGKTSVTFITESSLNGRILVQTLCALQKATINSFGLSPSPSPSPVVNLTLRVSKKITHTTL